MGKREAPVLFQPVVDSTNLGLRRLAAEGAAPGTVLWSARQTAGRGRLGRRFSSPEGGLYLSMLLAASPEPERDLSLTPLAAVAVCRAVEAVCGLRCGIKWPNDLQLGGKKLCGILTEGFAVGPARFVALGIGVNVNTVSFPPELADIAVSLRQHSGRETPVEDLAAALITELDALLAAWRREERAHLAAYRALCTTVGRELDVLASGEIRRGRAEAINDDFSLAVRYPDGSREDLRFGEVSVRQAPPMT